MVVEIEKRGDVGVVWIDNPPVNALAISVREGLVTALDDLAADGTITGVVIAGRGRTFVAGADIREFAAQPDPNVKAVDLFAALESFPKPTVAALNGTALGGGFELALVSNYRVALSSAKVGLPEVKLGLLPGGGGTQRLTRLVGVEQAAEIMLTGEPISAPAALRIGAVDQVVDDNLVDATVAFARQKAGTAPRRISEITIDRATLAPGYFDELRVRVAKQYRNQTAPQRIVDCMQAAVEMTFAEGKAFETKQFLQCRSDPQSRALQHVFFAERRAAKIPDLPADTRLRPVDTAAVIGAGTMGGGIAMSLVNVGIPTTLLDATQEGLDRGISVIRKNYDISVARGRLTVDEVKARMRLITPSLSYDDLADIDFIVEAVFETMQIKREVYAKLDKVAKKGAILASNTSRLSINELARSTTRPGDVVGTHFFSPANVMKLCEVVRGPTTADETLATTMAVVKRINKIGVISGDSDSFIGNRMLGAGAMQAGLLLLEGAAPLQIDTALYNFGMAMGPFQVSDLAGLDVGYRSRKNYPPETIDKRTTTLADRLVEMGRTGQKAGAGYYDYDGRTPKPSQLVLDMISEIAGEYGIPQRPFTDEEVVHRFMLATMNVGCDVLNEGVAYRASDIDVVFLNGYGHPAYHGGPMFWAEHEVGLPLALQKLREYSRLTGEKWLRPSPLLERLVAEGKGFAELDADK